MDIVIKFCKPPVPQAPCQEKLDPVMITELFKEAAVMKSFEHQNVLKLHGVTLDTVYRNEF